MIAARGRLLARAAGLILREAGPRLSAGMHQAGTDLAVSRGGWGSATPMMRVQRVSHKLPLLNVDAPPSSSPSSEVPPEAAARDPVAPPDVEEAASDNREEPLAATDPAEGEAYAASVEQEAAGPSDGNTTENVAQSSPSSAAWESLAASSSPSFVSDASPVEQAEERSNKDRLRELSADTGPVYARLLNAPKYLLRSDILRFFDCAVFKPESLILTYDPRYRAREWYLEFKDLRSFNIACEQTVLRRNMWYRPVRLSRVGRDALVSEVKLNDVSTYRERSLILMNLPDDVKVVDIEKLFHGHKLTGNSVKLFMIMHENLKTPLRLRLAGERRNNLQNVIERRAVVRFASELEAMRALREKQGDFVFDRAVEIRLLR